MSLSRYFCLQLFKVTGQSHWNLNVMANVKIKEPVNAKSYTYNCGWPPEHCKRSLKGYYQLSMCQRQFSFQIAFTHSPLKAIKIFLCANFKQIMSRFDVIIFQRSRLNSSRSKVTSQWQEKNAELCRQWLNIRYVKTVLAEKMHQILD